MSITKITLNSVRAIEVSGTEYLIEENIGFQASFRLKLLNEKKTTYNEGDTLEATFALETAENKDSKPFFKLVLKGTFTVDCDGISDWILSHDGAYSIGMTLFPYVRSLSKPMLEYLGAADLDFPFSPPKYDPHQTTDIDS